MGLTRFLFGRSRSRAARRPRVAPTWTSRGEARSADYDVVFVTLRGYQLRELGQVSRALSARGLRTAFVDADARPDPRVARTAQDAHLDVVPLARYVAGAARPRVLVVRSEVDDLVRGLVEHANGAGVATAAIAHPVINFTRYPAPYTASAVVLCAGRFSATRMHRDGLVVTGFPGLDDLADVARRPATPPRVLVNLSLPRGLGPKGVDLDAVRVRWMGEVRGACASLGVPFVVSRHPSDVGATYDWPVDPRSVYDVLPEVAVVVSPPSTVLMEAMVMGVPGVCHRDPSVAPFEMDTFDTPLGAFRNTHDRRALADALRDELACTAPPRRRFQAFLDEHVSVEPGRRMTDRVADALVSLAASGAVRAEEAR